MPDSLPLHILARHCVQSFFHFVLLALRTLLVSISWLALLPYGTVWIFRFYLVSADFVGTAVRLATGRMTLEAMGRAAMVSRSASNGTVLAEGAGFLNGTTPNPIGNLSMLVSKSPSSFLTGEEEPWRRLLRCD